MDSLPIPPKEPTPPTPSDESNSEVFSIIDTNAVQNDVFLSPYKENFQIRRPPSPSPPYSPMLPFSPVFHSMPGQPIAEDGKVAAPFNFQPMTLSKSPVTKSVGVLNLRQDIC